MEDFVLNGVGKKMRLGYINGKVSENQVRTAYHRNKKEADSFSLFGYKQAEIQQLYKETHNPILRQKLHDCLEEKKEISKKCRVQNEINIAKLDRFKEDACGIGLRKVIKRLKKWSKMYHNAETEMLLLLLETEYANLSAKQHSGLIKERIYERKSYLLYKMADRLERLGWKYGINDEAGKNACYLVYVYMPNDVQLTWHANDYDLYKRYPLINAAWDGQICMTMEKILSYIEEHYFTPQAVA